MLKVAYTVGGSGGPTAPMIALHEQLLKKLGANKYQAIFIGRKCGVEKTMIKSLMSEKSEQSLNVSYHTVPSGKLRRYFSVQNFIDPFKLFFAFLKGIVILLKYKPDLVISAGSFVSVPIAYSAKLLNIKHWIYQMDVRAGLANKLMAPVSDKLYYIFDETAKSFKSTLKKQKIGHLVRDSILNAHAENQIGGLQLDPNRPLLLVTGGGQGAIGLNQIVEKLLDTWLKTYNVVHLIGMGGQKIEHQDSHYHCVEFISKGMGDLIAKSSLVITRAGLGIIGELAALKKDSILVPIENSHQVQNAKAVCNKKSAYYWSQSKVLKDPIRHWNHFIERYNPKQSGLLLAKNYPANGAEMIAQDIANEF